MASSGVQLVARITHPRNNQVVWKRTTHAWHDSRPCYSYTNEDLTPFVLHGRSHLPTVVATWETKVTYGRASLNVPYRVKNRPRFEWNPLGFADMVEDNANPVVKTNRSSARFNKQNSWWCLRDELMASIIYLSLNPHVVHTNENHNHGCKGSITTGIVYSEHFGKRSWFPDLIEHLYQSGSLR